MEFGTILIVVFIFFFSLTFGLFMGCEIGYETESIKRDEEENDIDEKSDVCTCSDIDSKSNNSNLQVKLDEKLVDLKYLNYVLTKKTMFNKPSKNEMTMLKNECEIGKNILETIEKLSTQLDFNVETEHFDNELTTMRLNISNWEEILDKEAKLNKLLATKTTRDFESQVQENYWEWGSSGDISEMKNE